MHSLAALFHLAPWPPTLGPLFWIALTLVPGALLGECVYRCAGMPRIVGYGLAGLAIGWTGKGPGPGLPQGDLRLVIDLALALVLFELGSRVSLRWLRACPALLGASLAEAAVGSLAVALVLQALGMDMPTAMAGAAVTLPASAAMLGGVSTELKTAGQVTERMAVLAALNTVVAVLALKLIGAWLHLSRQDDWIPVASQALYTLAGSVLVAALLCLAVAGVMRGFNLHNGHAVLLLLGLLLLALSVVRMLALSTLLVPLLAGLMLRHARERPSLWPRYFGTAGGVLVLMMFVVMGLSCAEPALLAQGAQAAAALLLVRLASRALVLGATARWTGLEVRQGLALSLTLAPVSATTLVLLAELALDAPDVAATLTPAVLGAIAAMVLLGPVLVQWGLLWAGEYPAAAAPAQAGNGTGNSTAQRTEAAP